MDNIKIATSVYPIEYVVKYLYGNHSTVTSIYPYDSNILEFEVTKVLLKDYSSNDLFIFNGLSEEKKYVKSLKKYNNDLKIIDATSNLVYDYSIEELWLDPNNLLTIANNIKNGFEEYIDTKYLTNEINENYNSLKIKLTNLDGNIYTSIKNAKTNYIIITDDAFRFLEKYGLKIISLDEDTVTQKDILKAKELLSEGICKHVFMEYWQELSDTAKEIIDGYNASTLEFYSMTNLYELNIDKNDYITLMNDNLENLKNELYK